MMENIKTTKRNVLVRTTAWPPLFHAEKLLIALLAHPKAEANIKSYVYLRHPL
jgi:hypothetical protein